VPEFLIPPGRRPTSSDILWWWVASRGVCSQRRRPRNSTWTRETTSTWIAWPSLHLDETPPVHHPRTRSAMWWTESQTAHSPSSHLRCVHCEALAIELSRWVALWPLMVITLQSTRTSFCTYEEWFTHWWFTEKHSFESCLRLGVREQTHRSNHFVNQVLHVLDKRWVSESHSIRLYGVWITSTSTSTSTPHQTINQQKVSQTMCVCRCREVVIEPNCHNLPTFSSRVPPSLWFTLSQCLMSSFASFSNNGKDTLP